MSTCIVCLDECAHWHRPVACECSYPIHDHCHRATARLANIGCVYCRWRCVPRSSGRRTASAQVAYLAYVAAIALAVSMAVTFGLHVVATTLVRYDVGATTVGWMMLTTACVVAFGMDAILDGADGA